MKIKFILLRFWALVVVVALSILISFCFLPHDTYLRFKSLDVGVYAKAQWIYERVIFDDTPIDIAFIGTSHTLNSVDSEDIERGISRASKKKIHVVNFAIPHLGRDLHYILTKFLLEHKKLKLLVVEVREFEARDMHPATHYLADASDLISAPIFVNVRYFSNLSQLPLRQSSLFLQTYFPFLFLESNEFNPIKYVGPHLNYTKAKGDKPRYFAMSDTALKKAKKQYEIANKAKLIRTNELKNFLFLTSNKTALTRLVNTAYSYNVPVVFLYLPHYGAAHRSVDSEFHDSLAKTIIPPQSILSKTNIWFDLTHVNSKGANYISTWLSGELIKDYH